MEQSVLMEDVMTLMENFWIIRGEDHETYYRLKDNEERLKPFLEEKLGYRMHINPYLIKLDKVPGDAEPWMGIEDFKSPMDYCFLLLLLSFLEDKGPEEQFVLSDITEFIVSMYPEEEVVDWTVYQHRRSLVRTLGFARGMGIIKANDGDDQEFSQSQEIEVLYESMGVSRYFLRSFTRDITQMKDIDEILGSEWIDMDEDRGMIRRHRVYRKLVLSPVVYSGGQEDQDFYYIRNYRNIIDRDVEEYLGGQLHVHRNCALIMMDESYGMGDRFPAHNNLSDIVLQMSTILRRQVEDGKREPGVEGSIQLTQVDFRSLVKDCHGEFAHGWYKSYREMNMDKLCKEIQEYMIGWRMIEEDKALKTLKILPLTVKFSGGFPEGYGKDDKKK
ncbi:MAG TPA: TIGR02678 family protein [Clostridia bacterium]|nr:TIGR02678 family protein [Clostridia bacterium]